MSAKNQPNEYSFRTQARASVAIAQGAFQLPGFDGFENFAKLRTRPQPERNQVFARAPAAAE